MMNATEYKGIQEKFNRVVTHSQSINNPHTDELFEAWAKNKAHFIKDWGGLTYELPDVITLDRPEEDKKILFLDFIFDATIFAGEKRELVKEFIETQQKEGFYANRVITSFDKKGIKVPVGMKLSKALKFFYDDKVILDKIQTRMSRIIQDCKITGKMVMSVHPLDFLSSSETAHKWHSCHALDGEYRAGNLSYMADEHTFMFYLKAEEEYDLPNFPFKWNSKKWRMLAYMSKEQELIIAGRQYPFSNERATDICISMLKDKYDLSKHIEKWTDVSKTISDLMYDDLGSLHYNDCLTSPTYKPVAIYRADLENELYNPKNAFKMRIGDSVVCLDCGEEMISYSSTMSCEHCAGYTYCDCCGEAGFEDDMYYLEGELMCEFCFEEQGVYCQGCDETFNHYLTDMLWDEEDGCCYCPDCAQALEEKRKKEEEEIYSMVDFI